MIGQEHSAVRTPEQIAAIAAAEKWIGALHRRVKVATWTSAERYEVLTELPIALYELRKHAIVRATELNIMLAQLATIASLCSGMYDHERALIDIAVDSLENMLEEAIGAAKGKL
jgi:hypothetical protein